MSIGIGINVDAHQVQVARNAIQDMNGALRDTEKMDNIFPGAKGLENVSGLVKRVTEDVRRMQQIAASSDKKGGALDKNQFMEVEKIQKRLLETFGAYIGKVSLARSELKKLIQEKEKLAKKEDETGWLDPVERDRKEYLEKTIKLRSRFVQRNTDRVEELRMQLNAANETVGGSDIENGPGMGRQAMGGLMRGLPLKKIGVAAIAAYVGAKVFQGIREGMGVERAFSHQEAGMLMRGAKNLRRKSTYGFGPAEHIAIAGAIQSTSGYGGDELNKATETAKRFSVGEGVSSQSSASYIGSVAAMESLPALKMAEAMEKLRGAITTAGAKGRSEEFMTRNLQLLGRIAEGRGGEIDEKSADYITALQSSLWKGKDAVGKGQSGENIVSSLDNTIRTGGRSQGEQLLLWKALGGEKIRTTDDYWAYKKRLAEGATPDNVGRYYETVKKLYSDGSDKMWSLGKLALQAMMPNLSPKQIEKVVELGDSGKLKGKNLKEVFTATGSTAADAEMASGLRGNLDRSTQARKDDLEMDAGTTAVTVSNVATQTGTAMGETLLGQLRDLFSNGIKVSLSEEDKALLKEEEALYRHEETDH